MLLLTARAGARASEDDSDIGGGARAEAVHAFIEKRYASEVRHVALALSATAIAIGISLGLLALVILWLRGKPRRTLKGRFVESLALVAALHAAFFAYGMAQAPQLYAAHFYAQGGLSRLAQILATDTLGRAGVFLVAFALALYYARPNLVLRLRVVLSRVRSLARSALRSPGRAAVVTGIVASGGWLAFALPDVPAARAGGSGPNGAARPNVLILAADSLRDDHVVPRTMPNLSRYAESSMRFTRSYASLPRTFSSWVTLLTGRYAYHHGVRSMFPRWEDRAKDLDALPQRLAREGYQTGVVSDYAGDIFGRVDLGFQLTDTPGFDFRTLVRQRALERETPLLPFLHGSTGRKIFPVLKELNDAADPQMLAGDVHAALKRFRGKPFFLTVFFSTAHFPYAAPAPYYQKFAGAEYRGRYKYHKPVGLAHELPPDEEDIKQVRALYDGATSAIDDAMKSVLDDLESLGLANDTIVIVTADHGETLYEDGHGQGHGDHLFGDEGTHVPLIIHDPAKPKRAGANRVDGITRDVDVAATLYDLVGVKPPADLDGLSLAPQIAGEPLAPRVAFAESELWFTEEIQSLPPTMRMPYPGIFGLTEIDSQHGDEIVLRKNMVGLTTMARHRMAKDDKWKLVYVPTREGVKYMLFDTVHDPAEKEDVAKAHPDEVARLRAELMSWMLRDPKAKLSGGFVVPQEER
jgi:arylsulfatase A-like enzyme